MTATPIKEYLASLGFAVDQNSFKEFNAALKGADKNVLGLNLAFDKLARGLGSVGLGLTATAGGIALFTAGVSRLGRGLGNITMGVDKFALSLYTTNQNARNLQNVMKTMGIDSLDDLKYINLIPEQRRQFQELRALSAQLSPDPETLQGLAEIRRMGFEFQKMQIQLNYVGLKLLGDVGQMLRSPLFKLVPKAMEAVIAWLAYFAQTIGGTLKNKPVETVAAGGAGALAGGLGGSALGGFIGGGLGSVFGPAGTVIGAGIGRAVGGPAGAAVGAGAGVTALSLAPDIGKEVKKLIQGGISMSVPLPKLSNPLKGFFGKDPHGFKAYAFQEAQKYGFDPYVFLAQIGQESGWRTDAKSAMGARGIAQIMPGTAKSWGVNPWDPKAALSAAAKNMASYKATYMRQGHSEDRAIELALAAYNAGPGKVARYHGVPPYQETINYIKNITAAAERIRKQQEEAAQKAGISGKNVSIRIEVNGAKSPEETASAVASRLENMFTTRELRGFA